MSTADAMVSLGRVRPMPAAALLDPGSGAVDPSRLLTSRQGAFADVLGRALPTRRDDSTPESKAREAAEQFVAITFVQPVLKQVRETNRAAPPFGPSDGERSFRAMLDADLAQRIVRRADWGLVERLAGDLLKSRDAQSNKPDDGGPETRHGGVTPATGGEKS